MYLFAKQKHIDKENKLGSGQGIKSGRGMNEKVKIREGMGSVDTRGKIGMCEKNMTPKALSMKKNDR